MSNRMKLVYQLTSPEHDKPKPVVYRSVNIHRLQLKKG